MNAPRSAGRFGKKIKNFLFSRRKERKPPRSPSGPTARPTGPTGPTSKAAFETRLKALLSNKNLISAGRVQILGLDRIREHFGDGWESILDKVHATVRLTIEKRLTDADLYTRAGGLAYVIVFGELTKEEAQIKCALIAEEIWNRLVDDQVTAQDVEIKTVAADVDGRVLVEKVDLFSAVEGLMEGAGLGGAGLVVGHGKRAQDGAEAGLRPGERAVPRDLRFLYRPLWDVHRKALLSFLCMPVHKVSSGDLATGYDVLGVSSEVFLISELDMLVLRQVDRDLQLLDQKGRRLPVMCCVHFETLATAKSRGPYIDLCHRLPEPLRPYVIFEIVGFPNSARQARVAELIHDLRPFSRDVNVRMAPEHSNFESFRDVAIHAVGIDVGKTRRSERRVIQAMGTFAERAERAGFPTFIHEVNSTSLATEAVCAGFDYIDGDAVHRLTPAPADAFRFQPEDLFLHLLARAP